MNRSIWPKDDPAFRAALDLDLAELGEKFAAGEQFALMMAIRTCATYDVPLPEWAAMAFCRAYDAVVGARARGWDAVFPRAYRKGSHLAAIRKRREKQGAVWSAVREAHANGAPICPETFDAVGRKLGLGATLTADYYYAYDRWHDAVMAAARKG